MLNILDIRLIVCIAIGVIGVILFIFSIIKNDDTFIYTFLGCIIGILVSGAYIFYMTHNNSKDKYITSGKFTRSYQTFIRSVGSESYDFSSVRSYIPKEWLNNEGKIPSNIILRTYNQDQNIDITFNGLNSKSVCNYIVDLGRINRAIIPSNLNCDEDYNHILISFNLNR